MRRDRRKKKTREKIYKWGKKDETNRITKAGVQVAISRKKTLKRRYSKKEKGARNTSLEKSPPKGRSWKWKSVAG